MRRALEYAKPLGIVLAQHCEVGLAHQGRRHARGFVLQPARSARLAGAGRGADGVPRHRAGAPHRRADALPAPLARRAASSWCAQAKAEGLPITAEATPHHFTLTDELLGGLRLGVQGEPAAAHPRRHRRASRPAWPTAPSTPSPPTTRRTPPHTKEAPLDQAPPGMLGLETALALAITELDLPLAGSSRCSAGSRPPSPAWPTATVARSPPANRPTSPCSTPTAEWTVVPGEPGEQEPQHALRRPHGARQGAPHHLRRRRGGRRRHRPALGHLDGVGHQRRGSTCTQAHPKCRRQVPVGGFRTPTAGWKPSNGDVVRGE